jgi:hypothetical protein
VSVNSSLITSKQTLTYGLRKGDEYCKRWEVDKEGNWSGNLGWSAAVEDAIKAVKNEKGQKGG